MWYVISVINDEGKRYAFAEKINFNLNLVSYAKTDGVESITLFKTKHEAIQTANAWNEAYIRNGNCIY